MKLLFDQNLSPRLCTQLQNVWPDSAHVRALGLAAADDADIWAYAQQHGFTIVSKDGDFSARSFLHGAPPKVIWLTVGNCSTDEIERHLRSRRTAIETFAVDPDATLLVIEPGAGPTRT